MANEEKMSEGLAMQEIKRWADDNDIDLYVTVKDGTKLLDATAPKLIKAIRRGSLIVNDNCEFEYTVSDKSPEGYAGTKLVIEPVPGIASCMDCDEEFRIDVNDMRCPFCGSRSLTPVSGRDMTLREIEAW